MWAITALFKKTDSKAWGWLKSELAESQGSPAVRLSLSCRPSMNWGETVLD